MLDIKLIRKEPEKVKEALKKRFSDLSVDSILAVDRERRELLAEVEALRSRRNAVSQEIARLKKAGEAAEDKVAAMKELGAELKEKERALAEAEERFEAAVAAIPNIPH